MAEISIKITIADRTYPLKIQMEEEEVIRRAAKVINERIKDYQNNYSVKDKQDLLSMAVLHYATGMLRAEEDARRHDSVVAEKIYEIDHVLTEFFNSKNQGDK